MPTRIAPALFDPLQHNEKHAETAIFLVELFAGSHSVSRCVRRRFGESFDVRVLSVDNDAVSDPTILADINTWQYKRDIDDFLKQRRDNDIVACWSSPPCTAFSRANTTGVRIRERFGRQWGARQVYPIPSRLVYHLFDRGIRAVTMSDRGVRSQ